ncbi:hypothetical protein [Streptomyces mirabilis]|uniref:hypothetical protein n=1 Tax=Streptomyces mirabilis TaxID=68239 RepID=UPI00369E4510
MTPFQPEASANPPCTRTMVGLAFDWVLVWSTAAAVEPAGPTIAAVAATATPLTSARRRMINRRTCMAKLL